MTKNKREELIKLAERVKAGELLHSMPSEDWSATYDACRDAGFKGFVDICTACGNLSAIKALEEELLPDEFDIWVRCTPMEKRGNKWVHKWSVRIGSIAGVLKDDVWGKAPTEEAARLSALLLALSEMEN